MSKVSDQMQKEILAWQASGLSKKEFIKNKSYSQSKFDYWLNKYNAEPQSGNFEELNMVDPAESKQNKVLEIESPSGIKISVFL